MSKIPSWAIAVTGATIIVIATAVSSFMQYSFSKDINARQLEVREAYRELDLLRTAQYHADQRETTADALFGQVLENERERAFGQTPENAAAHALLLQLTASNFREALMSMLDASGLWPDDQALTGLQGPGVTVLSYLPAELDQQLLELQTGDFINVYAELKANIGQLRRSSEIYFDKKSAAIRKLESLVDTLQAKLSLVYLAYVFFNLVGFMITACKDLPLWRNR